ncbi:MAG: flagellar hook-length control protein FliK [bacterium]
MINNIIQKGIFLLKDGKNEVTIQLKPEILGQLKINISNENNHITIKMTTENIAVKELIENNISVLKNELQNTGIEINKMDIYVDIENDQYNAMRDNNDNIKKENDEEEEGNNNKKRSAEKRQKIDFIKNENSEIDFFA